MTQHVPSPKGTYRVFDVGESGEWQFLFGGLNSIQRDWVRIACQTIGKGQSNYKIGGMYLEFENVASPGDPVAIPEFSQSAGREYYDGLSGNQDYLRVPLIGDPTLSVSADMTDFFSGDGVDNNTATFFSQSSGVAGVNGLEFSSSANSKLFGLALVAIPDWGDRSLDLIFGRAYYAEGDQIVKAIAHQIGVSWTQKFG